MLPSGDSYEAVESQFAWAIPARYNIAQDVCDKWSDGSNRLALIVEARDGSQARYSFDDLQRLSNRFANALRARGVQRGERVASSMWMESRSSWPSAFAEALPCTRASRPYLT